MAVQILSLGYKAIRNGENPLLAIGRAGVLAEGPVRYRSAYVRCLARFGTAQDILDGITATYLDPHVRLLSIGFLDKFAQMQGDHEQFNRFLDILIERKDRMHPRTFEAISTRMLQALDLRIQTEARGGMQNLPITIEQVYTLDQQFAVLRDRAPILQRERATISEFGQEN